MEHARRAARRFGDPQGRPPNLDASPFIAAEPRARITRVDLPVGIVGGCRNHPDGMPVLREPSRHLTRIFADSGRFGREVDTVEQNLHHIFLPIAQRSESQPARVMPKLDWRAESGLGSFTSQSVPTSTRY